MIGMDTWRTALNKFFSEREISKTKRSIQSIKDNVIIPAFEELSEEMNQFDYVNAEIKSESYYEGHIGGRVCLYITQSKKPLFRCEIMFSPSVESSFKMSIRYSYGEEILGDDSVFHYVEKDMHYFTSEQIIELIVERFISTSRK